MANLKDIAENIKRNNLDQALNLCDLYDDVNNRHIIHNFKGVIYLIKEDLELSEENFLKSLKINPKFEDAIKISKSENKVINNDMNKNISPTTINNILLTASPKR